MKIQKQEPKLTSKIRFLRPFEKSILETLLILTLIALLFYLPYLHSPNLLLNRGNDLETFFWPLYSYVKDQILTNRQIPLVNNMYFAGTPLLSDPQTPYFYLPNILFLFVPINTGFIISFILHSIFSGLGAYLCAKKGFGFTEKASLIVGIIYMTTPKFSGYLEAGHVGLIYSWAWIPIVLWCLIKNLRKPSFNVSIFLSLGLSSLFFTHLVTFLIVFICSVIYMTISFLIANVKNKKSVIIYLILGYLTTFGIVAVSLFPQIEWENQSTRSILLKNPDVYPKWNSYKEIALDLVNPLLTNKQPDSEKFIPFGIFTIISLVLLFLTTKKRFKVLSFMVIVPIVLLALNNKSPFYELLLSINYYSLLRVSTRFWFIAMLFSSFGIGYLYNKSKNNIILIDLLVIFVISEQILTSWWYFLKPLNQQAGLAPMELLKYIKQDKDLFRVTCTTRCITAKDAFIYNIELIEGYNTVQQINFYKEAWQLTGSYWNYYTLSIPPFGTYLTETLRPDPKDLGEYNVKYIISPYKLLPNNLELIKTIANYYIYKNLLFKQRVYLLENNQDLPEPQLASYKPNSIRIDLQKPTSNKKVGVALVYGGGWKAYLDGKTSGVVQESPNALIQVDVKKDTSFVNLKYTPNSYIVGKNITFLTAIVLLIYLTKKKIKFFYYYVLKKRIFTQSEDGVKRLRKQLASRDENDN